MPQFSATRDANEPNDGRADFDPLFGRWNVHHRRLQKRLEGDTSWDEFSGVSEMRPLMNGLGNVDDNLLELPAGTLEPGEDALTAAKRELEEEVGVTASKMEKLCEFYVSPGFLTEKMFVYMATDLTETAQNLEDDEILTIERIPIQNAILMSQEGQIEDAKTIVGLMFANQKLGLP